MINKSKLTLLLALTIITSNSFGQQEAIAYSEMKLEKLHQFMDTFSYASTENFEDIFRIYKSEVPRELKHDILMLLYFDKSGILELFGPKGETLAQYLKLFTRDLFEDRMNLIDFRQRYLNKIILNKNFELLADIIEFGTKNGINFDSTHPILLNLLMTKEDLSEKIASRIINCLPHKVNSQDSWGFTPFMDAVRCGRLDFAKLLIDAKTNLEVKSTRHFVGNPNERVIVEGSTALDIAVAIKNLDLIKLLLNVGADTNTKHMTYANHEARKVIKEFKAEQKKIINSSLHNELPQVLVDIICQYLESKEV